MLIGRLAAGLHCYVPEELDETADLRLGRRRAQLVTAATASAQRIREFLSVAWPVVTETCALRWSQTWLAALQVATDRRRGPAGRPGRRGSPRGAVRLGGGAAAAAGLASWLTRGAVAWCRRGLLRRVAAELGDLAGPGQLRPSRRTWLRCWPSWACPGWAASRADRGRRGGDPGRDRRPPAMTAPPPWSSTPAWPGQNESGNFAGQAHISRRGRPACGWPPGAPSGRCCGTTGDGRQVRRAGRRRRPAAARPDANAAGRCRGTRRVACAASLLRWIYFMTVHGATWDAAAAAGLTASRRPPDQLPRPRCRGRLSHPPRTPGTASPLAVGA